MRHQRRRAAAFTLVELLVVIAIIGILAALLLPVLGSTMTHARRGNCISNVKQIDAGVMMYAADNHETLFPVLQNPHDARHFRFEEWTTYVPLVARYVGWNSAPSPLNKLFACPADTFHDKIPSSTTEWVNESLHSQSNVNYSSYIFNAGNAVFRGYPDQLKYPGMIPGVLGATLGSISKPDRTVLLGEWPAWSPYSWHSPPRPRKTLLNNSPDVLGFADGHVNYVKIFCGTNNPTGHLQSSFAFDPPPDYDYQWSGK